MSSTPSETNSSDDPLQSLIADFLDAEGRGTAIDREAWLAQHAAHADSLKEFLANHDRMKRTAPIPQQEATLPPNRDLNSNPDNDGTLLLAGDRSKGSREVSVGDRLRYFGDYELLEEIARGGMGVVYKALQINLNRTVALKMILSGQLASEEDVQRFRTEAEAAAGLDHPRIVPIYEVGQHAGQHYFSMGFVNGKSLAQKIVDGPMAPRDAAEMLVKICEGIAYAHARGVIHRDLKPANILLDQNEQPKVTDFGLAKKLGSDSNLTGTGQILGTPSYMAPEQASGRIDEVGPLSDVYSLGAILYCLLTGRPPFQAANPMDTLLQVLDKEPIPPRQMNPSIPLDLETITMRSLDKEPKLRFPSAQFMAQELERFLRGEPIQSRPIGPLERIRKWVRRRPQTAALIATASLVIMLLAIGIPLMKMREDRLRENVGDLQQDLTARTKEVTVAQKAAETALTEQQSTLRQKLENELEGFKVQVSANLDRLQAIRKRVVPGSSQNVKSLFLETSELQKSMSAIAAQLGTDAESQSEAYWKEMLPRINAEGIVWLTSSQLLSGSGTASQQSVSLSGHAFALAERPRVQAGSISRAFAVSADGKWLVRPIARKPPEFSSTDAPAFTPPKSPVIRQLELVSLERGGASQLLTPPIIGDDDYTVTIHSWSSTFTATNQLRIAYIRIRNGLKRQVELVVETRSLPLGKVEQSHSIDLTKVFPAVRNSYPERSFADNFLFVSPTIEFSHDASRVTVYQSVFDWSRNTSGADGWPAATFDVNTGECLGTSLQGVFPVGLNAKEGRLLLIQSDADKPESGAVTGFRMLDLISGEFIQLGGKGATEYYTSPHPFSLDPFPVEQVPFFQPKYIQVSPDGDFVAVAMILGDSSILRFVVIHTSDMSMQSIELPLTAEPLVAGLAGLGGTAAAPPSIGIAIRQDGQQACLVTGDDIHVFSVPKLQLITRQPINRTNSVGEVDSHNVSPDRLIRPFFTSYLDDNRIVCGFASEPVSDGFGLNPHVNDLARFAEHWQIFELSVGPLREAGKIEAGGAKTALLFPEGNDAIVAGARVSRVDLDAIRVEEVPGIDGRQGPQIRVPSARWSIDNLQSDWRQSAWNRGHFSIHRNSLLRPRIKSTFSRFMEQDDGIDSFVPNESDFDVTGRWYIHGNELWNVASGQRQRQFVTESGSQPRVAISDRWMAAYASGEPTRPMDNLENLDNLNGREVVNSGSILVWDLENDREHRRVSVSNEDGFYALRFMPSTPVLIASLATSTLLDAAEGTWLPTQSARSLFGIRSARQVDPSGRTYLYEYFQQRVQDQQQFNEQRFGMARLSDGVEIYSGDSNDLFYTVYSPRGTWLACLASNRSQPAESKGELILTSTETGATIRHKLDFAPDRDFAAANIEFSADEEFMLISADQTSSVMRERELTQKGSAYYTNVIEVRKIADWSRVLTTADIGNAIEYYLHPAADTIAIEFNGVSQPEMVAPGTSAALDLESERQKEQPWVEIRQLSTGQVIQKFTSARMEAPTGDGACLILDYNERRVVVDAASGELVLDLGITEGPIEVSPNGSLLLGHVFQGTSPRLWNVREKTHVDLELPGHLQSGFLPDSRRVIAFDPEKSEITLLDTSDGKRLLQFVLRGEHTLDGRLYNGTNPGTNLFRLSPDSKSLAVWMSNDLRVFGLDDGKLRFSVPRSRHAADVLAMDLSPDARWIATGSADQSVGIWHAETGEHIATLDGYGASVTEVKFTTDGRFLLSRDATGRIVMWQLEENDGARPSIRLRWKIEDSPATENAASICLIDRRNQFAYSRSDGSIALARLSDGATERTLTTESNSHPVCLASRRDGQMLAVANSDGFVDLWDLESDKLPARFETGQGTVGSLAFPFEDDTLMTAGTDLRLWSLTNHRLLLQCEESDSLIHHIDVSPDGQILLIVREDGSYSHIALGARREGLRSLGFGW